MSRIEWNDELSLGVEKIDTQHKELIELTNDVLEALKGEDASRVITAAVSRLRDYTVHHFSSEEELMREVHYPKRVEHIQEHARFKAEVKDMQRDIYEKRIPDAKEFKQFMAQWLLGHILSFDRELARFIRDPKSFE